MAKSDRFEQWGDRMEKQPQLKKHQSIPVWGWALILVIIAAAGLSLWRLAGAMPLLPFTADTAVPARERVIRVHVTGSVLQPGVYELPAGSRVQDAVEMAGGAGAQADLNGINLARFLKDGDGVQVPDIKAEPSPSPADHMQADINLASAAQLAKVPGFTQAMAEDIVKYREKYGAFESLEQLTQIKGIGAARLEAIRPYLILQ